MECAHLYELQENAVAALQRLNEITQEQIECVQRRDFQRVMDLDKRLEHLFGEKERAFGALKEHTTEHGCAYRFS